MRVISDVFTIIHIKISHLKFLGVSARHFITAALSAFLAVNTIQLVNSVRRFQNPWGFVEAAILIFLTVYSARLWIISWPMAGKHLNRAVDYENECKKR